MGASFPNLLLDLAVTGAMYGAIPVVLAFFIKTPIHRSLFKTICIVYTVVVAFVCALYSYSVGDTHNFTPALIWGLIFYKVGVSCLKTRDFLLENEPKTPKQEQVATEPPKQEPAYIMQPPVEYEQLKITVDPSPREEPKEELKEEPKIEPKAEPLAEPKTELTPEQNTEKSGRTTLFVSITAILIVAALAGGYYWGTQVGYDTGWDVGYEDGCYTGYETGYSLGYDNGKKVGFTNGYNSGKLSVKTENNNGTPTITYDPYVCVSTGGYSYHYGWCHYLTDTNRIRLSAAKEAGYTRCSFCDPPA